MVLNQHQQGLKGWPTPLTWFRLQSKDVYTSTQVPIQITFKLFAADSLRDYMVLTQGPSCTLKKSQTFAWKLCTHPPKIKYEQGVGS